MKGTNHIITNVSTVIVIDSCFKFLAQKFDIKIYDKIHDVTTWYPAVDTSSQLSSSIFGILVVAICAALFITGSLLPDIDHKNSTIGKMVHIPVQHRTWTHTIWVVAVLAVLSVFVPCFFWLCLGYTLHIFYDSLSKGGICWFYPISQYRKWTSGAQVKKNHKFYLYRTGETSELITTVLVTLIGASTLIYNIYLTVSSFNSPSP